MSENCHYWNDCYYYCYYWKVGVAWVEPWDEAWEVPWDPWVVALPWVPEAWVGEV